MAVQTSQISSANAKTHRKYHSKGHKRNLEPSPVSGRLGRCIGDSSVGAIRI